MKILTGNLTEKKKNLHKKLELQERKKIYIFGAGKQSASVSIRFVASLKLNSVVKGLSTTSRYWHELNEFFFISVVWIVVVCFIAFIDHREKYGSYNKIIKKNNKK